MIPGLLLEHQQVQETEIGLKRTGLTIVRPNLWQDNTLHFCLMSGQNNFTRQH